MHWDMYWERHSGIKAIFTGSLVPPSEMIYFVSYIVIVLNEMFFFYFLVNGYIYIYIISMDLSYLQYYNPEVILVDSKYDLLIN